MAIKRKYAEGTGAVTISEAARILGVSECGLRHRVKDGTMPSFRIGKLIRIRRDVLERIMNGETLK